MLKSILKRDGIKELTKDQQKHVNGNGGLNSFCHSGDDCDFGLVCAGCICRPIGGPV